MELEELKTKWRDLDGRLGRADEKIDRLTAEVTAGKMSSAKQRLTRLTRMGILLLVMLPFFLLNIFRHDGAGPDTAIVVLLALFVAAMLVRQVVLLSLLARIDPANQSVRETCAAVLRLRTCFIAGVGAGIVLAVPLLVALGIYMGRMTTPYAFYGFVAGLVIGLPLGVRIFLRMWGDINRLRMALQDAEE